MDIRTWKVLRVDPHGVKFHQDHYPLRSSPKLQSMDELHRQVPESYRTEIDESWKTVKGAPTSIELTPISFAETQQEITPAGPHVELPQNVTSNSIQTMPIPQKLPQNVQNDSTKTVPLPQQQELEEELEEAEFDQEFTVEVPKPLENQLKEAPKANAHPEQLLLTGDSKYELPSQDLLKVGPASKGKSKEIGRAHV